MTSFPEEQVYAREPRRRGAVLIIGTGAVGGYLAVALARLGISPLRLVDRDVLSVENLPRHPLGAPEIGQPKASALARRIRTDFPNCNAFGEDTDFMALDEPQQLALLRQADAVVAATDSIDCQRRMNELCVANRIPALYPGIWAADDIRDGEVGELLHVIPGEGTPCYQCYTSWRPQVGGAESRGGSGADLEQFALVVAWAVASLFDPDDPHADVFDPERTLTLVHSHSSSSPSIAHLFRNGNTRNLEVPFPRIRCPVCGGQEVSPPLPPAPPVPPVPVPAPVAQPTTSAMDDFLVFAARAAWLLGTIGALLILVRIDGAVHLWSNFLKILFWGGLDLGVIGYGLYRTFRDVDMSEIQFGLTEAFRRGDVSEIPFGLYRAFPIQGASEPPEPGVVWTGAAASVVLLIVGSVVLANSGGGPPAQASPAQQSVATPAVQGASGSPAAQPAGSPAGSPVVGSPVPTPGASSPSPAVSPLPQGWSGGQSVDNNGSYLTSVSCPTQNFCMAVDNGGNSGTYAYAYSNGTWSNGTAVDSQSDGFIQVSCASADFCAAISTTEAYMYSEGSWTSDSFPGVDNTVQALTAVSCPLVGYCFATSNNDYYIYSNGKWGPGISLEQQNDLTSLSCATTTFCMAGDNAGNVYEYSGGSWSGPTQTGADEQIGGITCPTATFCMVIAPGNTVYIYADGSWSNNQLYGADGGAANLNAISCASASFCVATGDYGPYMYSGDTWAKQVLLPENGYPGTSCPSAKFCMAVDGDGNAYTYWAG